MAKKAKTNYLNYVLFVFVAVCVSLLLAQMSMDTLNEVQTNASKQGYAVNSVIEAVRSDLTPTPTALPAGDQMEPTDNPSGPYFDTGE